MNAFDPLLRSAALPLEDTQSQVDGRQVPIEQVGIRRYRHPVSIRRADGRAAHTVANFSMSVGLAAEVKGAHMSRFAELAMNITEPLDLGAFGQLAQMMVERLEAASGRLEMRFTHFLDKVAPISGVKSLLDVEVAWLAELSSGGPARLVQEVVVPVTSLCPCSKQISDYGAHNQRSTITISAECAPSLSIEALVELAEREASAPLYAVLKRVDEKHVTEQAYDNPKFVEDLVRDLALACSQHEAIGAFALTVENFESIHNHSAYAELRGRGRLSGGAV